MGSWKFVVACIWFKKTIFSAEQQPIGEKSDMTKDGDIVQPPNEEREDKVLL